MDMGVYERMWTTLNDTHGAARVGIVADKGFLLVNFPYFFPAKKTFPIFKDILPPS
jgi:hypothetical protein